MAGGSVADAVGLDCQAGTGGWIQRGEEGYRGGVMKCCRPRGALTSVIS